MALELTPHYRSNDALLGDLRAFADRALDIGDIATPIVESAWTEMIERMAATVEAHVFTPWIQVAITFRLGARDQQLLLLALATALDDSYRKRLFEIASPSLSTSQAGGSSAAGSTESAGVPLQAIKHLFPDDTRPHLLPDAPLLRACLLDTSDASVPTMTGTYRLAQPLLAYLTGIAAPQLRIDEVPLVELEEDGALEDQLIDEETKRQLTRFIEASADSRFASQTFLLLLQGMDSALLKSLCAAIFAELGYATAELDGKRLRRAYERWGGRHSTLVNHLRVLCRDAVLCNTVIVLTDCQSLMGSIEGESTDDILDEVLHMLFDMHRYVVVLNPSLPRVLESAHRYLDHGVMPFRLRIDAPDADLRRRAWIKHAARYDLELDPEFIEQLVDGFHFTEERLPILLKEVATKTLLLDLPNVKDLVIEACRAEAQSGQIGVAKELKTSYRLRDVIAPEHTLDLLSELLTHVRYRRRVVEEWGFARHSGNRNVTAVFHGPSGTGKTMAASMIANELGLSIYRVDMASILSKYIGETERNLEQLFERAEAMNVVIFLDEAESLFGKRTENKDAHDRYANYQTAYLLQRIETYAGLVILATNLLGNIDKAFLRRFRFVINFPFPTTEQRKTLWRQAFPSATPIADDVDFDLLGEKAVLAGGSIQTAAISAAFRAAAQDVPVSMHHIVKSIEREYTKGGKVFVASDFGDAAIVYL